MSILNGLKLKRINLKVSNLEKASTFYQSIVGLQLIEKQNNLVRLGIDEDILLELIEDKNARLGHRYNGLYHIAFLLPTKVSLANVLMHLMDNEIRFGASDHGFSNALYLNDPDGNGIEIYIDTPIESWPYLKDDSLDVISTRLDLLSLSKLVEENEYRGLPSGTKIGHLHFKTNDISGHKKFYAENFEMDITIEIPHAIFASVEGYHHHIAANSWDQPIGKLPENFLGLQHYAISLDNFEELKSKLRNYPSFSENETHFSVIDPSGIQIIIEQ